MHVGTNNVEHTPEQVCEGILEIIRTIREKHPSAYIVLPVSMVYKTVNTFNSVNTFEMYILLIFLYFVLESTSSWSISKYIKGEEFKD